jgi:hypothetical protein
MVCVDFSIILYFVKNSPHIEMFPKKKAILFLRLRGCILTPHDPPRNIPFVLKDDGSSSQDILLEQDDMHHASTVLYLNNESPVPRTDLDVTAKRYNTAPTGSRNLAV